MIDAMRKYPGFYAPGSFYELTKKLAKGIIGYGRQDGRGLAADRRDDRADRARAIGNIVCAQPFGCLPNHIVRQGHDQ